MLNRALHAIYRRRARRVLQRIAIPSEVLFVCRANLCRSPYAAAAFLRDPRAISRGFQASSAGFAMADRPTPRTALLAAHRRGVDLGAHRSDAVSEPRVRRAGVIVVMEPSQARALRSRMAARDCLIIVLGDLDPRPFQPRAIRDPIQAAPMELETTYARIDRCVDALLTILAGAPGTPAGSITDRRDGGA